MRRSVNELHRAEIEQRLRDRGRRGPNAVRHLSPEELAAGKAHMQKPLKPEQESERAEI
jgi:hypothetical protein